MTYHSGYTAPNALQTASDTADQLSVSQEILEATTLVEKVMTIIRDRISAMSLMPGARLPSIRRLSETMSISKSTVVEAYDRLVAEGIIQARRGAGFYVAEKNHPPLISSDFADTHNRNINPYWVMRQSLSNTETTFRPGCGWLPSDWLPEEAIRRALRQIARNPASNISEYDEPLGLPLLRQLLSTRLREQGVTAAPSQILLTDSGTNALDLICRTFIRSGDTVLIDDPCYFNFRGLLLAQGVNLVGVPYTPQGPDLESFARLCTQYRPKLYLCNSGIHNPTGATIQPATAHRLLKLAEQHDLILVEDNIFADFHQNPPPLLAELDGLERVIHIGSFSKSLSAATRTGYIAARPDWLENLTDMKLATNFASNALSSQIIYQLLTDGSYRSHIEKIRVRLAECQTRTRQKLLNAGFKLWCEPVGGMFLWAQLPDDLPEGVDSDMIARRALDHNIVLAPGNIFSQSQTCSRFMRFNVAQSVHPKIFDTLRQIMYLPAT